MGQGPGGGADVHTHARPRTCDAEAQTERAPQQPNIEDAAERESASENNSFNSAADDLALSFARRRSAGYGRCSSDAGITAEDMDKMLAAVEAVAEDRKTKGKDSSAAFALGAGFGVGFGTRARVLALAAEENRQPYLPDWTADEECVHMNTRAPTSARAAANARFSRKSFTAEDGDYMSTVLEAADAHATEAGAECAAEQPAAENGVDKQTRARAAERMAELRAELVGLSRQELQARAKAVGVRTDAKSAEIIDALVNLLEAKQSDMAKSDVV